MERGHPQILVLQRNGEQGQNNMSEALVLTPETKPNSGNQILFLYRPVENDNDAGGERMGTTLTSRLRTSGFLRLIPPEDLKNLIYLLTFTREESPCQASLEQLA